MKREKKIPMAVYRILLEALRRYCSFHPGELLTEAWVGLGTESPYRAAVEGGYMTYHDGKKPFKRCSGWYVLTEKGARIVKQWLDNGYYYNSKNGTKSPNWPPSIPSLPDDE